MLLHLKIGKNNRTVKFLDQSKFSIDLVCVFEKSVYIVGQGQFSQGAPHIICPCLLWLSALGGKRIHKKIQLHNTQEKYTHLIKAMEISSKTTIKLIYTHKWVWIG